MFHYFSLHRWGKTTLDEDILSQLLPGAVTLVFERTLELNTQLNPYTSLVGIRIPDYEFIRQLARRCDAPLALTSANKSSTKSSLDIKVDMITVYMYSALRCIEFGI